MIRGINVVYMNVVIFQVSNWFINARVRLWKPMVEDMYQQEAKEEEGDGDDKSQSQNSGNNIIAQTPTPNSMTNSSSTNNNMTTTTTAAAPTTTTALGAAETGTAATPITVTSSKRSQINATDSDPSIVAINSFSENHATFPTNTHDPDDCRRGNFSGDGTTHMGSTMIRFGTTSGDVSLTLGLRHAGNLPENTHFFG